MKMPVTSLYRAPANTLINYDFVIGHKLPITNIIIIIYAVKKNRCQNYAKCFVAECGEPPFAQHKIIKNGKGLLRRATNRPAKSKTSDC